MGKDPKNLRGQSANAQGQPSHVMYGFEVFGKPSNGVADFFSKGKPANEGGGASVSVGRHGLRAKDIDKQTGKETIKDDWMTGSSCRPETEDLVSTTSRPPVLHRIVGSATLTGIQQLSPITREWRWAGVRHRLRAPEFLSVLVVGLNDATILMTFCL